MNIPTQPKQPIQGQQQTQPTARVVISHHWLTYLDDEGYRVYDITTRHQREQYITKEPMAEMLDRIKTYYNVQVLHVYRDYHWEVM